MIRSAQPQLAPPPGTVFSGGWIASSGGTVDIVEPATGRILGTAGVAGPADIRRAAARAHRAQPDWAARPPAERGAVLRRAAEMLAGYRTEAVDWIMREGGASAAKAEYEVGAVHDELMVASALATRPYGQLLPAEPERRSVARRVPLGVVGVISPWNVPMLLGMRAVAPALALGNAVVLKPDVRTPVSGGYLPAMIFEEAGLPPDALQVLAGGAAAGAVLVEDPHIAMIAFTGSSTTGRRVGEAAGRGLKRMCLELGGNNAFLVFADADLDAAASAGAWGSFFHQGQICMAAGRHIVLAEVAEEYLDRLARRAAALTVGDPRVNSTDLGPLIDEKQAARVERIVRDSVAAGAEVRTGGSRTGLFHEPTVLTGVTPGMPAFTEEIFGPVAPVTVARDEGEAIDLANRTEYGLSVAVQTGAPGRALALADRLDAALVHINDQTINDNAYVPFGGRKASGNGGRFGAEQSWEEFTEWQWVTVRETPVQFPF